MYILHKAKNLLVYKGTITGLRVSAVDGTAFIDNAGATIPTYADGNHLIEIYDSANRMLKGVLKAAGTVQTTTAELLANPNFTNVSKASAKAVVGITKANPAIVTFAAGHGYVNGDVIYFSGLTEMTELNTKYYQLRANSGDTFQLSTIFDTASLDTSGYTAAETTGGSCAQKTTYASISINSTGLYVGVDGAGGLTGIPVFVNSIGQIYGNVYPAAGKLYKLGWDIVAYTSGTVKMSGSGISQIEASSIGTYSAYQTVTSADTFYFGGKTGSAFTGTVDNETIKQVLTPSSAGATIVSAKAGETYNFAYKNASFTYNAASYYCVVRLIR